MPPGKPPFAITEDWPTPIVRDFGLFLDAVEKPTAFLQKSRQALDWATLYALNQEMRTFRSDAHPRMDQKYYPLLNLFQTLCVAAQLHVRQVERGKVHLIATPAAAAFRALSPAERYLALLEALWVDCPWDDLFVFPRTESAWDGEGLVRLLKSVPVAKPLTRNVLRRRLRRQEGYLPFHAVQTVRLLSFFGFLDYTVAPPRPGGYGYKGSFEIAEITVAPIGKAFFRILDAERNLLEWNLPWRSESGWAPGFLLDRLAGELGEDMEEPSAQEGTEAGQFIDVFLPLLAQGAVRNGLPRIRKELEDQTYVFRVTLVWGTYMTEEAWRTIALSSQDTLDDLHGAIQEAFRFDNDHMYAFHLDGKRRSRKQILDPRAEERAPSAADVVLGELGLFVGQTIRYIFDFGDEWNFDVQLIEIRDRPHEGRPTILERHGENPEQYPPYEEEQ